MASYRIRQYREQDYETVRTLFARGILEHAPAVYRHVLRSARAQLGLLVLFAAVWAAAGYWVLGLGSVALALAATWLLARTFTRAPDSGFWVAGAGGAVVGIVAATQPEDPAERGVALELKRMSVSKDYRGRGLSKALCREVLRFARARGYEAVVLSTTVVQVAAQQLYEGQGFREV
ncbi:putative N-acetyltransferase camello, partial [Tauraco erythrolophus]